MSQSATTVASNLGVTEIQSIYGRLQYSYDDKYRLILLLAMTGLLILQLINMHFSHLLV